MRWMSFDAGNGPSFGYVDGDQVVDVSDQGYGSLKDAIASDALVALGRVAGERHALDAITYLPTITQPNKILCVGLNYHAHREETGRGDGDAKPTIFTRFAAAQVGHNAPMVRPHESKALDYEGEIALVIGKPARRVKKDDWLAHVAGFGIYNDGSVRDFQRHTTQFTPGKNFAATGGFGPWMVTPDEIDDPYKLHLTTRLNGEVMQDAEASQLIFDFGDIVEYCSTWIELEPGDVLVTGTPGGVGAARKPPVFMDAGDVIEVEVAPIGVLRNDVVVG
ncbi:MAG: fumarylacetoacetate hydrolase family protein [Pseudomonadota bacterium]